MKFIVDHQLPAALARWLAARGADAVHVLDLALDTTPDTEIWIRAAAEVRIVVSPHRADRKAWMPSPPVPTNESIAVAMPMR